MKRSYYYDSCAFHDHCHRLAVAARRPSRENVEEVRRAEEAPPAQPAPAHAPVAPTEKRPLAA